MIGTSPSSSAPSSLSGTSATLAALEAYVQHLKAEVAILSADADTEVTKFGSTGFKSREDAICWIQKFSGGEQFDLVTDIYHFTMLMYKEIHGDSSFLKSLETAKKLGLHTLRKAITLNAFSTPVPLLFHDPDKLPATSSDDSAFSRYRTFSQWQSSQDQLQQKMNSVRLSLEKAIKGEIPTMEPAHQICLLAVSNTVSNLEDLFHFIDTTVEELKSYGLEVNRAFALCTHLASAYFHECHRLRRAGVSHSFNTSERKDLAGIIWFSVCQTQDVMHEFQTLDWKDHLVIAGVYIRYMVKNSQSTAPSTFDSRLDSLAKSVKAAGKTAENAQKTATTASSQANTAIKDAKEIAKCTRQNTFQKLESTVQSLSEKLEKMETAWKAAEAKLAKLS
mmetsp:Transcript_3333/g.5079  ORF Transcript_3333/g.5079 Transcript_3333/m.5079 type:complete len:392 (-) Transcript_3333:3723-4898(-)